MLSNFFNSPVIIPTVTASSQNAAFANGDIVFDWVSFDIPRGPARLLGATISIRSNDVKSSVAPLDLIFAKDAGTNTAPATLGTANQRLGLAGFSRTDIIGFLPGALADMTGEGVTATAVTYQTTATPAPGLILESSPNSGGTTGTDRFYVGGLAGGALDLTAGTTVDGTPGTGQANLDVTGDDADGVFAAGDVIHDEDDRLMGTIASLDSDDIVMAANLANAGVNTKKIYNINPIRIILHFEK
jgi:hypothetical protein